MTSMVGMPAAFPPPAACKRESQARRVRTPRGTRPGARGGVRSRSRPDRRVRALFLVHGRHRHVLRRRGRPSERGGERPRRAGSRAPAGDGLSRGSPERSDRCAPARASVRGAGLRHLSAAVKARLFTDGGARGNPGPAAYAYVLEAGDGTVLAAHGETIGVATNNVAEYSALVEGLRKAAELQLSELEVVSDSELLVNQMRGSYKVKNEALLELWREAMRLATTF